MSDLPASPTAPTSPLVDLRYTASAPLVGECQVVRDGARWVLRPHAPHVEGQCSCCAEITLVMDVDVALKRVSDGRWLVTRNDGADLGHLTDVPEPAPWLAQMPVAQAQPAQPQTLPTLDEVIAVLMPVLGPVSRRVSSIAEGDVAAWWERAGYDVRASDAGGVVMVSIDDSSPQTFETAWCVSHDGADFENDTTDRLDAIAGIVRDTLTRLGLSLALTTL